MRAVRVDVDVVEQVLLHEVAVALRMRRPQAHVFVEVERRDLREIEPLLPVQADQLAVQGQRRAAGRQAQHAIGLSADQVRDEPRRPPAGGFGVGLNDHAQAAILDDDNSTWNIAIGGQWQQASRYNRRPPLARFRT